MNTAINTGVSQDNPEGLTIDDLRHFLEQCQVAEIPAEAVPVVRVSLRGRIKRVEVKRW